MYYIIWYHYLKYRLLERGYLVAISITTVAADSLFSTSVFDKRGMKFTVGLPAYQKDVIFVIIIVPLIFMQPA